MWCIQSTSTHSRQTSRRDIRGTQYNRQMGNINYVKSHLVRQHKKTFVPDLLYVHIKFVRETKKFFFFCSRQLVHSFPVGKLREEITQEVSYYLDIAEIATELIKGYSLRIKVRRIFSWFRVFVPLTEYFCCHNIILRTYRVHLQKKKSFLAC